MPTGGWLTKPCGRSGMGTPEFLYKKTGRLEVALDVVIDDLGEYRRDRLQRGCQSLDDR